MSKPLPAFPVLLTVSEMGRVTVLLQESATRLTEELRVETNPTIRAYLEQRVQENEELARKLSGAWNQLALRPATPEE